MTKPILTAAARLNHVALLSPEIDQSADFYRALGFEPGFEKRDQEGRRTLLQMRLGKIFIELLAGPDHGAQGRPEHGHFGLHVASAESIRQRLVEQGLVPDGPCRRGASGIQYFFLRDPAGHWIEFTSP